MQDIMTSKMWDRTSEENRLELNDREFSEWNELRAEAEKECGAPFLIKLQGKSLPSNLRCFNLSLAQMKGTDLTNCNVSGTAECPTDLTNADLREANVSSIKFNRHMKCRGIRVEGCYGSAMFVRMVNDLAFIEELKAGALEAEEGHREWLKSHNRLLSFRDPNWRASLWPRVWKWGCDYGWGHWLLVKRFFQLAIIFAVIFWLEGLCHCGLINWKDSFAAEHNSFWGCMNRAMAAVYFSVVTLTTLGFGDIHAGNWVGSIVVMIEVILGYVMLGLLISILANKVARRA